MGVPQQLDGFFHGTIPNMDHLREPIWPGHAWDDQERNRLPKRPSNGLVTFSSWGWSGQLQRKQFWAHPKRPGLKGKKWQFVLQGFIRIRTCFQDCTVTCCLSKSIYLVELLLAFDGFNSIFLCRKTHHRFVISVKDWKTTVCFGLPTIVSG